MSDQKPKEKEVKEQEGQCSFFMPLGFIQKLDSGKITCLIIMFYDHEENKISTIFPTGDGITQEERIAILKKFKCYPGG